ncbi:MAG: 50S ribosomal protein L11 methyltransferase [Arcobacteraceae bacterium]|nr:50S ribosomal protein L11 methyltransferase [Arcobacteraceae bacterium]
MNKFYYELIIQPESYYELFLDLAVSLVDEAIEELDGTIIIRSEDDLVDIEAGMIAFANELTRAFNSEISCKTTLEKKENIDWIKAYQDSVKAIEVGDFYIHPSWAEPNDTKKNILIDPALTFGSGHHETTSTCLESISKYVQKGDSVIDVGCGSGILGIASAKLEAVVDICDTDIIAVEDAVKNFEVNGVSCDNFWEGSCKDTIKTYDVVIANIVADVLIMINKDLKKVTKNNGIIILSGIMDKYKDKVLNKFQDCELIEEIQKNEWVTLIVKYGSK